MTRDDIIRMAREAEIIVTGEAVWRLCELVASAEREACALVCERRHMGDLTREDMEARRCAEAIRARGQA